VQNVESDTEIGQKEAFCKGLNILSLIMLYMAVYICYFEKVYTEQLNLICQEDYQLTFKKSLNQWVSVLYFICFQKEAMKKSFIFAPSASCAKLPQISAETGGR
jgi:hypothetical protein